MNTKQPVSILGRIIGKSPRPTLRRSLLLTILVYMALRYIFLPVRVQGLSMEPTFRHQSIHLANLFAYARKDPRRGDVILISTSGRSAMYLKRVLALPGERVSFMGGRLFVNGGAIDERYLRARGSWTMPELLLRANEYFVAGDNRSVDINFHALGTVNRSDILGKVVF
jgi:signal peptidase I